MRLSSRFVHDKGLTLGEIVVAIGLLGTVIAVILSVFGHLLAATTKSGDVLVGVSFGQRVLQESIAKQDFKTIELATGSEGILTHDRQSRTVFHHKLKAARIYNNARGELWQLEVDVHWWSDAEAEAERVGYGKLSVHQSRTVFISK